MKFLCTSHPDHHLPLVPGAGSGGRGEEAGAGGHYGGGEERGRGSPALGGGRDHDAHTHDMDDAEVKIWHWFKHFFMK